jgi:hypothetical protein
MSEITDEFSFKHPDNKGYGKVRRLKPLSSGDEHFSTSTSITRSTLSSSIITPHYSREIVSQGLEASQEAKAKDSRYFQDPLIRFKSHTVPPLSVHLNSRFFEEILTLSSSAMVTSSPALRNRTKNPANEQLLFHGTNRFCRLAEDASRVRLCNLSKCHLCSVIRNSFDVKRCGAYESSFSYNISNYYSTGTKHKFRRFGTGIYTTTCSSSESCHHQTTCRCLT